MAAIKGRPQGPHFVRRKRPNLNWQEHAACIDANPNIFFDPERYTDALAVCADCSVKEPCRKLGRNVEGVWGGVINQKRSDVEATRARDRARKAEQRKDKKAMSL